MFGLAFRPRLFMALALVGIGLFKLLDWTAEYHWFEALGYESVFWTIRELKLFSFLAAFTFAFAYFWINIRIFTVNSDLTVVNDALKMWWLGRPLGPVGSTASHSDLGKTSRTRTPDLLILATVLSALVFGFVFYSQWDTLLRFWWTQPYGESDPIFSQDISFYLFELPFLNLLQNSLQIVSLLVFILLALGYFYAGNLPAEWKRLTTVSTEVLFHLAVNLTVFFLAVAWGFYLDRFELLLSQRGAVFGIGYTEFHVVLPAIWILLVATLCLIPILFVAQHRRKARLLVITISGYATMLLLGLAFVPIGVQSFVVEPNELGLETPFLRHNIALTRKAYQLEQVGERSYDALGDLESTTLLKNQQTIDNIRLWDWRPLSETFRQIQQIRTYYEFSDVDVDRYRFGDETRQVMLAVRELSNTLPNKADTWVNRRLQYTHGYGLVMSLTAKKSAEGNPILMVKDLPPHGERGISVQKPAIYYGENMRGYRIVNTAVREFDFPKGDQNVYTRYGGHGGINIGSIWKKLLFSWHQFDLNIAITSYVTPQSRIQFWRDVKSRVERIAPFLRFDNDPYPVLSNGRIYWVQDAYTVSSHFPYSEPHRDGYNYIRNSVKVVVDAYDGNANFYVIDSKDPVLAVYRQALPTLFTSLEKMPNDLRRHLRYPQDLFEAQVTKYSTYHMTVPQVFYNGEDLWAVPREKYGGEVINMKPYYILVRLPGEEELQFLLMLPLTPANRANMIAWMAARSDFPRYGELLVYKLPKERLIPGPIQVEAKIDQDTLISQQLSLWDQRGSRVVRGNLLVIPIDQSFIYVEPVYLIAEDSAIPQLKRVIVSDGEKLAMEPTLREALKKVFGLETSKPIQSDVRSEASEVSAAREALAKAEEALRDGNWDLFGRAMLELKELLAE